MDYLSLFDDFNIFEKEETKEEINEDCCDNKEIIISDFNNVCRNCGCVSKDKVDNDGDYSDNAVKVIDIFNESKSTSFWIRGGSEFSALKRLNKWSNYSSKEAEANKCYLIIKTLLENIVPNFKENMCIGEKILIQAKLYWRQLYMIDKIATRGAPRNCLFVFCIIKSLEYHEIPFELLDLLKTLEIDIGKYNKALLRKVEGDDKTFVNPRFFKYLEIIQKYNKDITLNDLIEKYNINKKNKIKCNSLEKKLRININDNSMLKGISYYYIKDFITKQEICIELDISSLTLNKSIKLII